MTTPTVSLVTVTYNNAAELEHFWQGWPADACQWIVVDNASDDGSAQVAQGLTTLSGQLTASSGTLATSTSQLRALLASQLPPGSTALTAFDAYTFQVKSGPKVEKVRVEGRKTAYTYSFDRAAGPVPGRLAGV